MKNEAPSPFSSRSPHSPMVIAAFIFVGLTLAFTQWSVRGRLPSSMAAFAERPSPIKLTGNVLQDEAFRLPAILPIYGSSELDRPADNRPDAFFRDRPTGFSVFPIGRGGTTCLMILQKIAAVGEAARGKKAVIILSPTWFAKDGVGENAVDANLTPPQLNAWLFDNSLSATLRQRIAVRLQDYPTSLHNQPLLTNAVRCLAEPTLLNRVVFRLLTPVGRMQNVLFRQLEYCALFREMWSHTDRRKAALTPSGRTEVGIDWDRLAADAEARDRAVDDGAVYSATNLIVPENRKAQRINAQAPGSRDEDFASKVILSKEFDDLRLLIDVLNELGVRAMFVNQPFNGIFRDLGGTTRRSRQVYYDKLTKMLKEAGFPLQDYSEHEEDRFFFNDANHPSAKAWIYYDRGIDRFYHETRG